MTFLGPIEKLHFWNRMRAGSYTKNDVLKREFERCDEDELPEPGGWYDPRFVARFGVRAWGGDE